jgi:Tetratricopeptide Repeats-Sensor
MTKEGSYLDQAIRAYERAFYLGNDYYNGINYAYLLNERAAHAEKLTDRIADFIQARRVRLEVLEICDEWITANPERPSTSAQSAERRFWVLAVIAEAHIGLEDGQGEQRLTEALAAAPAEWMKETSREQVTKLKALLAASPLKKLPASR